MREIYKLLSAIGDFFSIVNGGASGYGKRQVNKQAHKMTAKAMRKLWK